MSTGRALAANTIFQVIGKILSTVIGVAIVAIMTRELGTHGFGAYSTANAFLQVFAIIIDMGLNVMVVQMLGERAGDKKFEDRATSAVFSLRFWSGLIILSIAPFIGLVTNYSSEIKIALFAVWGSFFFTALNQIVIGIQQRHLKAHVVAISEVAGRVALFIGIILAARLNWGLIPMVLIVSFAGFVNFIINFLVARTYACFHLGFDWDFWKITLQRSWPIGVSILFSLIYFKSDTLILSFVRSIHEVGLYSAAYRVLEILATFPFMYSGVLLPIIANAWAKGDKERFAYFIKKSFDAFSVITFPMVAGVLLIADQAMVAISGIEYLPSANILRVLIIATGCIYIGTVFSHAIVALNLQRYMLRYYAIIALVTLGLYIWLIPPYGVWAAAWLTVFSEAAIALVTIIITLVHANMKLNYTVAGKAILGSVLMYAVCAPLIHISLILTIVVAITIYTLIIFASGAVDKQTIKELLRARKGTGTVDNP